MLASLLASEPTSCVLSPLSASDTRISFGPLDDDAICRSTRWERSLKGASLQGAWRKRSRHPTPPSCCQTCSWSKFRGKWASSAFANQLRGPFKKTCMHSPMPPLPLPPPLLPLLPLPRAVTSGSAALRGGSRRRAARQPTPRRCRGRRTAPAAARPANRLAARGGGTDRLGTTPSRLRGGVQTMGGCSTAEVDC